MFDLLIVTLALVALGPINVPIKVLRVGALLPSRRVGSGNSRFSLVLLGLWIVLRDGRRLVLRWASSSAHPTSWQIFTLHV